MATILQDPFLDPQKTGEGGCTHELDMSQPGSGPKKLDTTVPPKAKPVLSEIKVNGVLVPEEEILNEAQHHPAETPGEAVLMAARALVVRELLLQEAAKLNLEPAPQTDNTGAEETRHDALIRQLMESEIVTPVTSNDERQRYYEANRSAFSSEAIYEARHILLAVKSESEQPKAREIAQSLIGQLQAKPELFGPLALEHSDCPSRESGGNLGQLTRGSTVAEFEKTLDRMEPGQLWPEPVQSRFGYHIIQLDRKIPGKPLPFEAVEERIGAWLEASSWSRAVSQYISILAGKATIEGIEFDAASSPLVQ